MDKLLKLLCKNSQFSTAELAAMLGEPEDYIKAQIREYENSGVIKGYQAVVDWEDLPDSYVEALIELSAWRLKRWSRFISWRASTTWR